MEANNSSAATLLRTLTKTSSASASSVSQTNSASKALAFPYISSRTAFTVATKRKTKARSLPTARSIQLLPLTIQSASTPFPTTSAWCKISSAKSCARTTTRRLWKTKTCHRSSASPNPGCHRPARSHRPASVRSANNSKQPRRSASWKRIRNSRRLSASSSCRCQSPGRTATSQRKSTGTSMARCSVQKV